jgi:putative membrane protein
VTGKELFAAINATFNACSAVLLISAYVMVLRKNYRAHATLMIAALTTSAAFLGFYIYSKAVFGEQSSGIASGPLKTFYLLLLASHVLLAVLMLPPIVITVWRAYTRQWISHRRWARPTLWVWLYVSVTGVIVYFMLFHLFPSMRV